jgi:hypothetical protein
METDIVAKFANKTGFIRNRRPSGKNFAASDINVFTFFGDMHHTILSGALFFDRLVDNSKYNIVLTWPGMECFFSTADEILTLSPDLQYEKIYNNANDSKNNSVNHDLIVRTANEYFLNVKTADNFVGSTQNAMQKILDSNFLNYQYHKFLEQSGNFKSPPKQKKSVVFFPIKEYKTIISNAEIPVIFNDKAYREIFRILGDRGFQVVCIQNKWTFNLQNENFGNVVFVNEYKFENILQCIRKYGCYFDLFTDNSILAMLAQVPVFSVNLRSIYNKYKRDVESYIFDFENKNKTIYSFFESLFNDTSLNYDYLISIIDRFADFYEESSIGYKPDLVKEKEINLAGYIKQINRYKKAKFISKCLFTKEREKKDAQG